LGLVRHLQNKFSLAIPAFEKAVRLKRIFGRLFIFGHRLLPDEQFPQALAALAKAGKLQPEQPEIRFWLGATHIALKHYLEGQEILEELSEDNRKTWKSFAFSRRVTQITPCRCTIRLRPNIPIQRGLCVSMARRSRAKDSARQRWLNIGKRRVCGRT